jgi:hypothetical protein
LQPESVLVLRPGFSRCGWMLGGAAFLAGFGLVMESPGSAWAYWWLALAGLLAAFAVWVLLAPRMRLGLSPTGIEYGTLRRRYSYRWSAIARFGVSEFGSHHWVVFVFAAQYNGEERLRRINQAFGGFDRFLPDTYGLGPAALVELLETWRLRHTRQAEPIATADRPGD